VRRFESGQCGAAEFGHSVVSEFELSVTPEVFLEHFERWPTGPYPGALELLALLRPHFRVACLSNCNELHWPRFLDEMELGTAFDHHFASHELGALKPDREVFERVTQELGCSAERVLFLDDNEINVAGARDAGLHAHRVQGLDDARRLLSELELL
jgi:putative hydrolase of the HAD superfamily